MQTHQALDNTLTRPRTSAPAAGSSREDRQQIRDLLENWVVWRDSGDWERFRSVWHDDGVMMATWFQGSGDAFIAVSQEGWAKGVSILHFLGGIAIDLAGQRAISQTKMTISQRASVDGVVSDVTCTGRFYDFLEKRDAQGAPSASGQWGIVLRQPIYEKDRIDPVDPAAILALDPALLAAFPEGYRHLAYLQTRIGYVVKPDMPGLKGPAVEALYARGRHWLVVARFEDAPSSAFTYLANPARVLFGAGRLGELAAEIETLGRRRALLIATPEQRAFVEGVAAGLGHSCVGVFAGAAMHTPSDVTDAALAMLNALEADVLVALGGGSTIGLGKALALRTTLPLIAVPTTYAGSEMTRILGETSAGRKTTISSDIVLPKVVIYDVELTLTLPVPLSVVSGFNAIAHAAEALYARNANPIVSLLAEEGIGALAAGLSGLKAEPRAIAARSQAQYGAWLCGTCLGSAGMALHHKICHVLGGTFGLPHAETHTVMLAHVMAYNAAAAPAAMARLARALGAEDAAQGLHALAVALDAPLSLAGLGMSADGLDLATELALKDAYWNPRPLEAIAIRAMLQRAHAGDRPLAA